MTWWKLAILAVGYYFLLETEGKIFATVCGCSFILYVEISEKISRLEEQLLSARREIKEIGDRV
jgi:hypothetical protein